MTIVRRALFIALLQIVVCGAAAGIQQRPAAKFISEPASLTDSYDASLAPSDVSIMRTSTVHRSPQYYGNNNMRGAAFGYSYVGYINRQARRYPVMMYTLVQCIPCQRAKHMLAVNYSDVPSHFLELGGNDDWQRQLQVDLFRVTRQDTFPYVFVCGQFIGGSSDLMNLHHSGQLRQLLNSCMNRG